MEKKSQKDSHSLPLRNRPPQWVKCPACGELAHLLFDGLHGTRWQGLKLCAYCVVTSHNLGPNGCIECGL